MIINVPKEISFLSNLTYSSNGCPQMVHMSSTNLNDILQLYELGYRTHQYVVPVDKFWSPSRFFDFLEALPGRVFVQPAAFGSSCNIVFERPEDQQAYNQVRERYDFSLKTSVKEDVEEIKEWIAQIDHSRVDIKSSMSEIHKIVFRDHEDAVAFRLKFTDLVKEI